MSYVICPMSYVLCHMSYVLCHMSYVIRPMSYVARLAPQSNYNFFYLSPKHLTFVNAKYAVAGSITEVDEKGS